MALCVRGPTRRAVGERVCAVRRGVSLLVLGLGAPSFQAIMSSGKFHGMIWPTTCHRAHNQSPGAVGHSGPTYPNRLLLDVAEDVVHASDRARGRDNLTVDLVGPAGVVAVALYGERQVGEPAVEISS
jgi:hypothetical protein